jgi:hypothetical protein
MNMRLTKLMTGVILSGALILAQGPPPGGPGFRGGRGFGGPGGREFGPGGLAQGKVTGQPYSAMEVTESTQTLGNGTQITRKEQTQVYRDSMGRVRTETTMTRPGGSTATGTGQSRTMVTIYDPVEGSVTRLDSQRQTADKTMLPTGANGGGNPGRRGPGLNGNGPGNRARTAGANAPQVQKEELGTKTLASLSVSGTRTTMTIPAGAEGNSQAIQTVHEVWRSADLQVPVMTTITDPRSGTRVTQLTNVNRNEPDAGLFQTPSGYTLRTHSRPGGPR